ncbi:hypothetical protein OA493_03820 [Gammaproteobacteria bacterium]|nr:hypothetical protein [Gammaproteobacteria bacterium]
MDVYSDFADIKKWNEEDFQYFVNGLESGDISYSWAIGTTGNKYFRDQEKGELWISNSKKPPCYRLENNILFEWEEAIPSGQCLLIEKRDLDYINKLIFTGNQNRMNDIQYAQKQKRLEQQRKVEQERVRKEQERERIEQQIKAREAQFANYIMPFKRQCRAFGYSDENLVARCVQDFVFADMAAKEMAEQLQRLKQRQDQIRINNAIATMGKELTNIGNRKTQTQICNFKAFSGAIIKGDCKNLSINSGGVTYWRQ